MNIFKSLSQGNGRISETNITSFLSFLLNSTNEFDNSFLLLFFELIDKSLSANKIMDMLQLRQQSFREKIAILSRNYIITAEPEFNVKKDGSAQIIDVFLKITDKKAETDIAYILIENKIKQSAAKKEQVSKQFEYFRQTDVNHSLPVYSLLITTDFDSFKPMYTNILQVNERSSWLRWTNKKENENSLEAILRNMLVLEQQAHIQPINPNSQFIIKSFIDYIVTEYSNTAAGEKNFNFNGSEELDKAEVDVEGKRYILRRYENKMIRVFDEDDNVLDIEVLPLLKKVNQQYNLNIAIAHTSGTPKNTQVFGREIISGINSIQLI